MTRPEGGTMEEVLRRWPTLAADLADAKADAIDEALVALDAVQELVEPSRRTDVRQTLALLRDQRNEYREEAGQVRPAADV